MSVILKIDPSKKDVIINNNHNGITINHNNVSKRKVPGQLVASHRHETQNIPLVKEEQFSGEFVMKTSSLNLL